MALTFLQTRRNLGRALASGDVTVAEGGVVTAAGSRGTNSIARTLAELRAELPLSPTEFGADRTGTSDSTNAFLQWRDALSQAISGEHRAISGFIPRGNYRLTAEVAFPILDPGMTNGRLIIRGEGNRNTHLRSEALTGNVFSFAGGGLLIEDFSIDASPARKAAMLGLEEGNGIYTYNPDYTALSTTMAIANFNRIAILSQPNCAWKCWAPEMFNWHTCVAYQCGLHGFHLVGTNGSNPQGINNTTFGCRSISCGGNGLRLEDIINNSIYGHEALGCGSEAYPHGIWANNVGNAFYGLDIEGKEKFGVVSTLYGIALASKSQLYGGYFGQLNFGIHLNGASGVIIEYPTMNNTGLAAMARAIQMASCTNCVINIRDANSHPNVVSITDALQHQGNSISFNGVPQRFFATATFTDATSRLNTVAKTIGLQCFNTTTRLWLTASGTSATSPWYDAAGNLVYTPS